MSASSDKRGPKWGVPVEETEEALKPVRQTRPVEEWINATTILGKARERGAGLARRTAMFSYVAAGSQQNG